MATAELRGKVRDHARLVNAAIDQYLPSREEAFARAQADGFDARVPVAPPLAMLEPMRHVVAAGGKRIRPTLCLLAHEAAGGRAREALPTAVGIEFLHSFTLVHDDIMDRSLARRAVPTVGALWGDDVAITVGDALFALAFEAFAANGDDPAIGPARALAVVRDASRVCLELAQGQMLDLLHAQRADVSATEHLEMVRLKTGVLLEFSLSAGARLAGASDAYVRALSAFGAPLGVAFQLRDDVLDLVGDPARMGKPSLGDLRMGKRTLAVAHAFEHSAEAERLAAILDAAPERKTVADLHEARKILEAAGSIAFATSVAERHLDDAKRALASVPGEASHLAALASMADYVAHRAE